MKTQQSLVSRMFVALTTVLIVLLASGHAGAELDASTICNNLVEYGGDDYDRDGFLNREECEGLVQGIGGASLNWPGWKQSSTKEKPKLDPTRSDLLIILVRANPTYIPTNEPFIYISNAQIVGGLGINVYEIPEADVNAVLASNRMVVNRGATYQKAIKVQESLIPYPVFGKCDEEWATPNGLDNCWVFTQEIRNFIDTMCTNIAPDKCQDKATGITLATGLYDLFIRHTIAHECGHDMKLRGIYVSEAGGYHYPSKDHVTMSQSVEYKQAKTSVTWQIGTKYFAPNDMNDFTLWEPQP